MRIGITCYPTYGGSGVIATELGKALAARGHVVHFISYALPFRLKEFSSNIFYHEVDVTNYPLFEYPPYSIALASKMADIISFESLELLHVHYAIPHAMSALLAKEMLKEKEDRHQNFKLVTTLHGTDITIVGKDPSMAEAVRLGVNRSDGVTTVSDFLRQQTISNFETKKHIEVIPNFIDTKEFIRDECAQFRNVFALPEEKVLIHISNFRPVKRVKEVIKIFYHINKAIPCRMLLIGDGPERMDAEMLSRKLDIADKVKFLGRQEALVALLSISDLMIMPSESESFGLAALEAMACGVPVLATAVGGLPELIQNGVDGCLQPLENVEQMADCAISILQNQEVHQRFAKNARAKAETYDTDDIVSLYEAFYAKMLTKCS
ncbi:glycosyl transferase group 1 [Chloroherpeton thalassium ATCC 35110]|uniref:Glycosyl transferase group 1 n=1 Tax=Chloroherpeton thalassium (strain ATCC 35110 / GB-78) TaxID=517418 RepID=B3QV50_CHLT3|nr:N-acetyl-alpha-D-glucosaminyl L-malate synthase BshA [Chloroherpeton thalassium]ACF13004.1 glycosyl transferase group 1 [Chloroherpeton thalassium ATCC 35110]